jgi:hypothetical protein
MAEEGVVEVTAGEGIAEKARAGVPRIRNYNPWEDPTMGLLTLLRLGALGALAAAAAACTVSTTDSPSWASGSAGGQVPVSGCAHCDDDGGGPSSTVLLATVDPNVTMTATPGQGIGVFTEYDSGGRWHIWWTCDTALTQELCAFDVKISVATGTITEASADRFSSSDTLATPSTPAPGPAGAIEALTTTTLNTEGVFFDTDPGATITLSATVGGVYSGQFLFWVQSGKINDGYTGAVTDPLKLKGASP